MKHHIVSILAISWTLFSRGKVKGSVDLVPKSIFIIIIVNLFRLLYQIIIETFLSLGCVSQNHRLK